MNYYVNNMYIHEIALHPEHDAEDFRPPFFISAEDPKTQPKLCVAFINGVMTCVSSAQMLLKVFNKMSPEDIRSFPAFLYARLLYGCIVLIKLDVSIDSPTSQIGKIVERDSLMASYHVEKTLIQLRKVAGVDSKCIMGAKFYMILSKLVNWYRSLPQGGPKTFCQDVAMATSVTSATLSSGVNPGVGPQKMAAQTEAKESALPTSETTVQREAGFSYAAGPSQDFSKIPSKPAAETAGPENTKSSPSPHQSSGAEATSSQAGNSQGTPATDYSSPDMIDTSSAARLPYEFPMEVDTSMFNQLEGVDPFNYNQDPNDWMFDGMDYSALENVEGLDWSGVSGHHQTGGFQEGPGGSGGGGGGNGAAH